MTDQSTTLEHAYLRLRTMIPGAFDISRPLGRGDEVVWRITEQALRALVSRHDLMDRYLDESGERLAFERWLRRSLKLPDPEPSPGGINVWKEP